MIRGADLSVLLRQIAARKLIIASGKALSCHSDRNGAILTKVCEFWKQPRRFGSKEKVERQLNKLREKQMKKIEAKKKLPRIDISTEVRVEELMKITGRSPEQIFMVKALCEGVTFIEHKRYPLNLTLSGGLLSCIMKKLGFRANFIKHQSTKSAEDRDVYAKPVTSDISKLKPRPPIVAVMGHVDHGKTTILDGLRKTSVAANEAGGITQSIGAFSVPLSSNRSICFIDTPGHSVFTSMRERGAMVTDIVVLVVAADDGVMEQTVESINMTKRSEAKVVVAINKCDKAGAAPDLVLEELKSYGIKCEDVGGDVPAVKISALKNIGLDRLMETIVATAEMSALVCDPEMQVQGFILEARTEKNMGNAASLVVKQGTLVVGQILLAGTSFAKVKLILDVNGKKLKCLKPGEAGTVIGWKTLPSAGQVVLEASNDVSAKRAIRQRQNELNLLRSDDIWEEISEQREIDRRHYNEIRFKHLRKRQRFAESVKYANLKNKTDTSVPSLNIVIKADVDGSMEAIMKILDSYDCEDKCSLKVVSSGIGDLKYSEYEMAKELDATIFLFNTDISPETKSKCLDDDSILRHQVIYHMVESLREQLSDKLPPLEKSIIKGEGEVLQVFKAKKLLIAGCKVTSGVLDMEYNFALVRDGEILHKGPLTSMKQHASSISKMAAGNECGIVFEDELNCGILEGDKIQCLEIVEEDQDISWRPPGF